MFYQSLVSTHNVWLEGICLTKIKINKRRQMTNSFYCGQLGFIGNHEFYSCAYISIEDFIYFSLLSIIEIISLYIKRCWS